MPLNRKRACRHPCPEEADVTNVNTTVAITVAIPMLPSSISDMTIRRRTGWLTTDSASLVVKPAPVKAERTWKRTASRDNPVAIKAMAAMRVIISDKATMTNNDIRGNIVIAY